MGDGTQRPDGMALLADSKTIVKGMLMTHQWREVGLDDRRSHDLWCETDGAVSLGKEVTQHQGG